MKLVEKTLKNIPQSTLVKVGKDLDMSWSSVATCLNALIPGVLSAIKAKLVTSIDEGNINEFLETLNSFSHETLDHTMLINNLFGNNSEAFDTLLQRVESFSGVDSIKIGQFVPQMLPSILSAIVDMIESVSEESAIEPNSNFLKRFLKNNYENTSYASAVKDANNFLGKIFGGTTQQKLAEQSLQNDPTQPQNDIVNTILDLFDRDNDGSVMDDIYNMLVKTS